MAILTTLLIALLVLVCLFMVLLILMQRPKQEGLGAAFGGGMTDSMFGAQTTDVLQKGTTYLAVAFFVICIALAAIKTRHYQAEATKGDSLIGNDPAVVTPFPEMPDLNASPLDPNIPLPGGDGAAPTDGSSTAEAPIPAPAANIELLPPPMVDEKPKADAPAPAPKAETTPKADAPAPAPSGEAPQ